MEARGPSFLNTIGFNSPLFIFVSKGFLPYRPGTPYPVASAPIEALMCFGLSPLKRRNSSQPLCDWSLTSKLRLKTVKILP